MKSLVRAALIGLVALWAGAIAAQDPAPVNGTMVETIRPDWAGSLWDDSRAEVATYEGHRIIYSEDRPHELRLITVAEDINKEFMVKAEWPYGQKPLLPALKQLQISSIPTPNYPYNYLTTVFYQRSNINNAVKMTISSQEWCGTTFKQYELWRETAVFWYSSYWDGEGTGNTQLTDHTANTYFEEELPLLFRALPFREGLKTGLMLQPPQTTNRVQIPEPVPAVAMVDHPNEDLTVPAGTYAAEEVWRVSLEARDGRRANFYIADDDANTLLAFEFDDGRRFELKHTTRRQYWRIGG
ncbi:hypothetical protein KQI84_16280 [bacterium]|nr:hypothetical protein [bacterium]